MGGFDRRPPFASVKNKCYIAGLKHIMNSFGCDYLIQISATGDIYLSLFDKIYKNDSILYSTEDQFFESVCVVE